MEIRLKNIGLVEDSTIKLDGLTVLTGKNESGKTTVGKALYALIEAVRNLRGKAERDKEHYIKKQLEVLSTASSLYVAFRSGPRKLKNMTDRYLYLSFLSSPGFASQMSHMKAEKLARRVEEELVSFRTLWDAKEETILADAELGAYLRSYQYFFAGRRKVSEAEVIRSIQEQCNLDRHFIEELLDDVNGDPELIHYARESVNQTLKDEFSGQIQPFGCQKNSSIQISDENNLYFDVNVVKNQVDKSKNRFFASAVSPVQTAYFVDELSALDRLPDSVSGYLYARIHPESEESDSFFDSDRIPGHMEQLRTVLRLKQDTSPLEKRILDDKLRPVMEIMNRVVPGAYDFSDEEDYYIREDGTKLRVENMAAGSKVFSIIKILLERGLLNQSSILILDEPEVHLHPDWQNQFAELIVLLVKELHIRVFLATHSSDFMLAIDAFMRKHNINDVTNFYQAERQKNGFVRHNCVNDNMELIYQDFLASFSEMKLLRDRYVYDAADNENETDGEET